MWFVCVGEGMQGISWPGNKEIKYLNLNCLGVGFHSVTFLIIIGILATGDIMNSCPGIIFHNLIHLFLQKKHFQQNG